ncbi:PD-(D/E)XK nuclease-like domain-containing protein [Mesorhizobium sp. M0296]|uniref:PD-(D/E)XK nuclease-like domain-containing protein n=1 Tax=Mesorhizobium sp. M0296 TaxID=2956931 RepID=UPI003339AE59
MNAIPKGFKPGIYQGVPNEAYHSGPGVSKSGLWTIHSQSPAHYKSPPAKDEESTQVKANRDFGTAAHIAILEPETFEKRVFRGPVDRRGNKWTDAEEFCQSEDKTLLVASAYDEVLAMRDAVHADAWVNSIITGGKPEIEASGYWIDPATGMICRCRPDLYRADLGIIVDLKSALSAHPDAFARSVTNYGYHAQEAIYSDGWRTLGRSVEGFVFLAWEKKSPYAFGVYELPPSIVEEGRAVMRKALDTYAECVKANHWPAYGDGVQELSFKRWAYRLTEAPNGMDGEEAA